MKGPMDTNLLRYIWSHTRAQQLWILAVVLASMPTYFWSLDLPRYIVNGPIQGRGFENPEDTQTFMNLTLSAPSWLPISGSVELFRGFELTRLEMLFALSCVFLFLVIVNGLFKYYINTYKGRLGERMLRRIRFDLLDRVLRFPINQFKRVKSAEVASMVKDEVEPMGGFIGDAFVQPVFLGGQAITAMLFILVQNMWLGLIAGSIIAVQFVLIPRLRRRLIVLQKERQITARELAGRVGEVVEGITAVHTNDTSNYERADASNRLSKIYDIRFELYQRKFFVKFLNNFLAQLTPFLFYAVGGYFALRGTLDVGQLVAVISAYKDLPSPIKELIDWDQQRLEVGVKFGQVVEQFTVEEMMDRRAQSLHPEPVKPLTEPLSVNNLTVADDTGARLLESTSITINPGERIALVGSVNSGAETMAEVLARLQLPSIGKASVGKDDIFEMPEAVTGRRFGFGSSDAFLPQGTVRDSLLYVLKHAPLRAAPPDATPGRDMERFAHEAKRAGNSPLDIHADWIDYEAAGADGPDSILTVIKRVLKVCGLADDIFDLGLRGTIRPEDNPELAERVVEARHELRHRLSAPELAHLVEPFSADGYSRQATVAENLLFGTPVGPTFSEANLAGNAHMKRVLKENGLDQQLFDIGRQIASTTLELFEDLPPGHPFFEQLSFMTADQIPDYQQALQRLQGVTFANASEADRNMIIRLTFAYIEPRHRLGLLNDEVMAKIVEARHRFRDTLPPALESAIEFYDDNRYNGSASIQDNLLLGRIAYGVAGGTERVLKIVRELIAEMNLVDSIFDIGLEYNIGSGGKRLTAVQRQKLAVARVLVKRPDYAIFNRPLAALDLRAQEEIIERVLKELASNPHPTAVIWVVGNPTLARFFERVTVFDQGRLVEDGHPGELAERNGTYARLVA